MTKLPHGEFQTHDRTSLYAGFARPRFGSLFYRDFGKRILDLALAILTLPLTAPLIAILGLASLIAGGKGFFGHTRVGRNGKLFRCWKIQTMVSNADEVLVQYLAANPDEAKVWQRDFKLERDPRVTPLGRVLRKTSLDEVPQIWNVIIGDMSFVGPRPVTLPELAKYGTSRAMYESVRPGITGLWQVSGRNDLSYDERVALDRRYVASHGLVGDLRILAMTALAVVFGTGR